MLRVELVPRQELEPRRRPQGRARCALPVHSACAKRTAHANANLQMKQHLAVSAIGSDRTGMVHELTRVISECGGNISESRMASLGTEFAMLLLVSGQLARAREARDRAQAPRRDQQPQHPPEAHRAAHGTHRHAAVLDRRRVPGPDRHRLGPVRASSPPAASTSRKCPPAAIRPRTPARRCSPCR